MSQSSAFEPSYLALYRSGELPRRVAALETRLTDCDLCPHDCHVDRRQEKPVFCRSAMIPVIASICAHYGEEPPLSSTKGSGTVFFGNCNMRCTYCQNYQISQDNGCLRGKEMDIETLARQLLYLQNVLGCHNINFVSPSHFVPQMARVVLTAIPLGLHIPLVYNTGGYDSVDTLKLLDGIIDIYLPDIRYASDETAKKYSGVNGYVEANRAAIKEMYRQVGNLTCDEYDIAQKGLIIRHLILPNKLAGSRESLTWLTHELSPDIFVSVMSQYYPAHRAARFTELARRITPAEYDEVMQALEELGMENGWIQDMEAPDNYRPDFDKEGHPFTP
jgi:putative pyruvate formate lyase activating enzyme